MAPASWDLRPDSITYASGVVRTSTYKKCRYADRNDTHEFFVHETMSDNEAWKIYKKRYLSGVNMNTDNWLVRTCTSAADWSTGTVTNAVYLGDPTSTGLTYQKLMSAKALMDACAMPQHLLRDDDEVEKLRRRAVAAVHEKQKRRNEILLLC